MRVCVFLLVVWLVGCAGKHAKLKVPPMGWMSWEIFRCQVDCVKFPGSCINETLFLDVGERLVADGYAAAGYRTVSIDDCWMARERQSGSLVADKSRFPHGMLWLSRQMQHLNLSLGTYFDIGKETCQRYPGTQGFEMADATLLQEWEIDYIKVDGCFLDTKTSSYEQEYVTFGQALGSIEHPVAYSCSWPAYISPAEREDLKPYDKFVSAGCDLWRNWEDIQCSWDSLVRIIDHFGNYSRFLASVAGPGRYNDMDMILAGNTCISLSQAQIQLGIWSIMASPLIMGNDIRKVHPDHKALLLNTEVISINQDPIGIPGFRISPFSHDGEIWARALSNNHLAIGFLNKSSQNLTISTHLDNVLKELGMGSLNPSSFVVRDVFLRKDAGVWVTNENYSISVKPFSLKLFRLSPLPREETIAVE